MNDLLLYLSKSTLCMSALYLVFRIVMRKQTFFQLNRVILLSIVVFSVIIPLVHLPYTVQPAFSFQPAPAAKQINTYQPEKQKDATLTGKDVANQPSKSSSRNLAFSWPQLLQMIYLSGLSVALLASLTGFLPLIALFRKTPVIRKDGFRLLIARGHVPAFSIGRYMIISYDDYQTNCEAILKHEQAHIRFGHFYDLIFLEVVKISYWFNPLIYLLIRDLKAVHEFQADERTLNNGIDVTQYQLLIIQKCVGPQKFALANSFNHCQIKNRIVMMNKQKTSKAWRWTAAAFLPVLALLLMAFGRTSENAPPKNSVNKDFSISKNVTVKDSTIKSVEKVYTTVEQKPQFPGGDKAKEKWIHKHLKFSEETKAKGINGSVSLNFTVDSKGKVKDVKIVESTNQELAAEYLRVFSIMPDWIPGRQNGVPVSASVNLAIGIITFIPPSHIKQSKQIDSDKNNK